MKSTLKYLIICFGILFGIVIAPKKSYSQFRNISPYTRNILSTSAYPIPEPMSPVQEKFIWIGLEGGINFVHFSSATFAIENSDPTTLTAQNGSGKAPFFGASYEIPIDFVNHNFIVLEVLYDSKSAAFTTSGSQNVPIKINGNVGNGNISGDLNASLSYLTFTLGYKYNFIEAPRPVGPGFQISANIGYALTSTLNKAITFTNKSSDGSVNSQTETISEAIDGLHSLRIGLRAKISYDIPINETAILSPVFGYDLPFTKVDNTNRSWTASSLFLGIAIHSSLSVGY
jgi:hypothetical protein